MRSVNYVKEKIKRMTNIIPSGNPGFVLIDMEAGETYASLPDHIKNDPSIAIIVDNIIDGRAVEVR
jgi:hypothetical protein